MLLVGGWVTGWVVVRFGRMGRWMGEVFSRALLSRRAREWVPPRVATERGKRDADTRNGAANKRG